MRPGLGAPRQGLQAEGMDVELGDLIALADQAEELALGGGQGRVRHHVEQADMQLADVLMQGPAGVEDVLPLVAQAGEGRQVIVGDDGHGVNPQPLRAMACSTRSRKSRSSRTRATSVDERV